MRQSTLSIYFNYKLTKMIKFEENNFLELILHNLHDVQITISPKRINSISFLKFLLQNNMLYLLMDSV